jgi:hypothetical protein
LSLYGVTDPCIQHAIKKLLVAGDRGHKDIEHDVQDAIDTLTRWQEMRGEDDRLEGDRLEEVGLSRVVNVNTTIVGDTTCILPTLKSALKMPNVKPPKPEPASEIDDESERQKIVQQSGEMAEHVYPAVDAAKDCGCPKLIASCRLNACPRVKRED